MSRRLTVDPVACEGHGLCADLFPERIGLDEWGFPLLEGGRSSAPLAERDLRAARAAVRACPTLALRLERARAGDAS